MAASKFDLGADYNTIFSPAENKKNDTISNFLSQAEFARLLN